MSESVNIVEVWARKFIRPRVNTYIAADRMWGFVWNRYNEIPHIDPGVTIGVALVLGIRVISLQWARPTVRRVAP